jgi:hypothetical protein
MGAIPAGSGVASGAGSRVSSGAGAAEGLAEEAGAGALWQAPAMVIRASPATHGARARDVRLILACINDPPVSFVRQ